MSHSYRVILSKNHKRKDGTFPLYLQVIISREKAWFALDLRIEPEKFLETGVISSAYPEAADYNILINQKLTKANEIIMRYRIMGEPLTLATFKAEYTKKTGNSDFITFFSDRLIYRIRKNLIEKNTIKGERSTLNKLREFRKSIPFNEFTLSMLHDFDTFLTLVHKNKQNTRWGRFKHIRAAYDQALEEGKAVSNPFKKFALSMVEGPITYLSQDELARLMQYYLSETTSYQHKKVLKYFLFSCFTGLRISDVSTIDDENLLDETLVFVPIKTKKKGKFIRLPLSGHALSLVTSIFTGKLFETYSDQATNRFLKQIAAANEIKKRLTFHVARHTFATVFLELGGKIEVLQEFLGHTKITTTRRYVHVSDKRKKLEMSIFNNLNLNVATSNAVKPGV